MDRGHKLAPSAGKIRLGLNYRAIRAQDMLPLSQLD